jgi:AcrR family transcriptional regulator
MVETGTAGTGTGTGAGTAAGTKRGRRTDGGQAKEAIRQAARELFAEHGFDRTSVRQIALAAHVDPMLVTHYFTSKAGRFAAVVQPPVDPQVAIDFAMADGPDHVGERLARFVLRTLESPDSQKWIVAMVRAATAEPEIAAVVRERMAEPMVIPLAEAAGGDHPDYRAMLVITQLLGLVMARYILKIEPLASQDAERVAADLAGTFQRYLTGPLSKG